MKTITKIKAIEFFNKGFDIWVKDIHESEQEMHAIGLQYGDEIDELNNFKGYYI